jgi:hypothetical protein
MDIRSGAQFWVCVGFLQAERKDDRIGSKEGKAKREEGKERSICELSSRVDGPPWHKKS